MPQHQPGFATYFIPILILLPFLYFRLRRSLKPQALKLSRLSIRPAILLAMAAFVLLAPIPGAPRLAGADMLWLALAAGLGAAAGWQWGRTTQLHIHPENGTLMQTGSIAGIIMLIVLVVLRAGLNLEAGAWHINALLIADVLILFSTLLFAVRGLEIFLRARKIMATAVPAAFD